MRRGPSCDSREKTLLIEQNTVRPGYGARKTVTLKAAVGRVLIDALSRTCKAFCILSGYEGLPDDFDTDIDFMVSREDFERVPAMIDGVAAQTGMSLFQAVDHEITGRAYFLGSVAGSSLTVIQPDSASDYHHFGRIWLTADEVLSARRWHPNGFWIPSAAHEFAYYLIKRLNKGSFNLDHGYKLHRLYVEDRIGCGRLVARFCKGGEGSTIVRMASANDWTPLMEDPARFRRALIRSRKESMQERLRTAPLHALQFLRRVTQPTGCWVAFMGPDGCGKSTVLTALNREFRSVFNDVQYFHMRPRIINRQPASAAPVTDPHGQPPRGLAASIAKVVDLTVDYFLGYLFSILPAVIRTNMVLFDRCFYDLVVDGRRIRYGGPPALLAAAAQIAPGPDLVILLDAAPQVLWSRKQEVPLEELARQRAAYLELVRKTKNAVVVDASQPAEKVIEDAIAVIMEHLGRRTRKRLRLPALDHASGSSDRRASSGKW